MLILNFSWLYYKFNRYCDIWMIDIILENIYSFLVMEFSFDSFRLVELQVSISFVLISYLCTFSWVEYPKSLLLFYTHSVNGVIVL